MTPRPAIGGSETPGRALLRARALQAYADPARPYIHTFDGGLSEKLGLAEMIRAFEILKVDPDEAVLPALRRARTVVVIAVNAQSFPQVDWDRSAAPPDTQTLIDQMVSIPVDRITLDGVEQVREKLTAWQSAPVGRERLSTTNAAMASPVKSSGRPTTAASATSGCATSADSISIVPMRWPETFSTSSMRPVIRK